MFFLSVEDDLMRIFAGDKLEGLLGSNKLGLEDGEALEHPLISKMLERAQAKVESMHFDVRKNLLKFDDVMNDQRKAIYEQRREIMDAESIEDLVVDMRHQVIEDTVKATIPPGSYPEQWDVDSLHTECHRLLGIDLPVKKWAQEEGIADNEIIERIIDESDKRMAGKVGRYGANIWRQLEKSIVLQLLDQLWKEHLLNLDHVRQGINLRAFGQKDPLNEYKTEAFGAFEHMLSIMNETITQTLCLVEINTQGNEDLQKMMDQEEQEMHETRQDPALMGTGAPQQPQQQSTVQPMQQKQAFDENDPATWGKIQRNAPCPCGSGKKYKHCHGKIVQNA